MMLHSACSIAATVVQLDVRSATRSVGVSFAQNPSRRIAAQCAYVRIVMAIFRTVAALLMRRKNPAPRELRWLAKRWNADRSSNLERRSLQGASYYILKAELREAKRKRVDILLLAVLYQKRVRIRR